MSRTKRKCCSKCKQLKLLFCFRFVSSKNWTNSMCRECERAYHNTYNRKNKQWKKEYRQKNKDNFRFFVQERISGWRSKPGPKSNLDVDYLVALWKNQNGKCHYTDEQLVFNRGAGKPLHDSASLDRLDPNEGYVKDNVVWCSYLTNTMKQNLTRDEFFEILKKIVSLENESPILGHQE